MYRSGVSESTVFKAEKCIAEGDFVDVMHELKRLLEEAWNDFQKCQPKNL